MSTMRAMANKLLLAQNELRNEVKMLKRSGITRNVDASTTQNAVLPPDDPVDEADVSAHKSTYNGNPLENDEKASTIHTDANPLPNPSDTTLLSNLYDNEPLPNPSHTNQLHYPSETTLPNMPDTNQLPNPSDTSPLAKPSDNSPLPKPSDNNPLPNPSINPTTDQHMNAFIISLKLSNKWPPVLSKPLFMTPLYSNSVFIAAFSTNISQVISSILPFV
ncbi:hypothetical protein ACHAWX_001317 [Stephanocyclus meneghinianus]